MEELINFTGGRNLLNNDLRALQNQLFSAAEQYQGYGNLCVSGGRITPNGANYNISKALLYFEDNGKSILISYPGATNVSLGGTTCLILNRIETTPRFYTLSNNTQNGIAQYTISLSSSITGNHILISPSGISNRFDAIPRGPIGTFLHGSYNDFLFNPTGLGIGILTGWALANGNNGTHNLIGRYLRGVNLGNAAMNQQAGAEFHKHKIGECPSLQSELTLGFLNDDSASRVRVFRQQVATVEQSPNPPTINIFASVINTENTLPFVALHPIYSENTNHLDPHHTTKIIQRIF